MKAKEDPTDPENSRPFLELSEEIPLDWRYQGDHSQQASPQPQARDQAATERQNAENDFLAPDSLPLSYQNPLLLQAQSQQERASRISRRVSAGLIIGGILLVIPVTRVFILGFMLEFLLLMRILTLPLLLAGGLWMVYRLFYQRP